VVLFEGQQNDADTWILGNVTIPGGIGRIAIEGVRGRDWAGDIAIDDLAMLSGSCSDVGRKYPICYFEIAIINKSLGIWNIFSFVLELF
jgi:hypothetical protein